jgi:hypothetical protein
MAAAQHIRCVRTVGSLKGGNIYGVSLDKGYCQYLLTALKLLMALKLFFCATYNMMYWGSVL